MPEPDVSVVLCTRNSRAIAEDTLVSLRWQSLARERYEVVVVDNASDPDQAAWLAERSEKLGFRLVREERLGLSHARNCGISHAKGSLIHFIDDDAVAPAYLLEALWQGFEQENADVVGGPVHGNWEHTPPDWLRPSHWRSLSLVSYGGRDRSLRYPEIPIGCNVGFRRDVFTRFGGFDPELGRKGPGLAGDEERELIERIVQGGGRVHYVARAAVFHKVPAQRMTLEYLRKRSFSGAKSRLYAEAKKGVTPRRPWLPLPIGPLGALRMLRRAWDRAAESMAVDAAFIREGRRAAGEFEAP